MGDMSWAKAGWSLLSAGCIIGSGLFANAAAVHWRHINHSFGAGIFFSLAFGIGGVLAFLMFLTKWKRSLGWIMDTTLIGGVTCLIATITFGGLASHWAHVQGGMMWAGIVPSVLFGILTFLAFLKYVHEDLGLIPGPNADEKARAIGVSFA